MKKRRHMALILLGLYLGVYHGRIALFDTEKAQPAETFPYRLENYPPSDQQALRKGIPVTDREHLQRLLEDFTS